eukprot:scpid28271/ scgid14573/ Nucleotide-binding oligomerization domain-containing protein 2; Caspase recruitment domain-containing protein 15
MAPTTRYVAKCRRRQQQTAAAGAAVQGDFPSPPCPECERLPEAVVQLRRRLSKKYMSQAYVRFGLLSPSSCIRKLKVDHVFGRLLILPRKVLATEMYQKGMLGSLNDLDRVEHMYSEAGSQLKTISLDDLFRADGSDDMSLVPEAYRIVAVASAGCGKTMLFTIKATQDWILGRLWVNKFDVLVARELRSVSVQQAKSISDLLSLGHIGMRRPADQYDIEEFVMDNLERVCLILDGFDETTMEQCSTFIQDIIRGKELVGLKLILTSRPSPEVFELAKWFDMRIELIGFMPDDMKQYIRNVLEPVKAEQVVEAIGTNPRLASIMSTPFFAKATCELYEWRPELPACISDIFDSMILHIAERADPQEASTKHYSSWSEVPKKIQDHVLELGLFAFLTLIDRKLVFYEEDFRTLGLSDEAIHLGLLVACEKSPFDIALQWRFSHLTLQECLAARFIAVRTCPDRGDEYWLVQQLGALKKHLNTFWVLLCGQLEPARVATLLTAMLCDKLGRFINPRAKDIQRSVEHMLFMAEKDIRALHSLLCELINYDEMCKLADILLSDAVGRSGQRYVEELMPVGRTYRDTDYLQLLLYTWLSVEPRASRRSLVDAVSTFSMPKAQVLAQHFQPTLDEAGRTVILERSAEENSVLCKELMQAASQQFFIWSQGAGEVLLLAQWCFSEYAQHAGDHAQAIPILGYLLGKYGINSVGHRIPLSGCRSISDTLIYHHDNITVINFFYSHMTDSGLQQLVPGLKACSNAIELHLDGCDLTSDAVPWLCEALPCMDSLVRLSLSDNEIGDDGFGNICMVLLRYNTSLQFLSLYKMLLTPTSLLALSQLLESLLRVDEIELDRNDFCTASEKTQQRFVKALSTCEHMKSLRMPSQLLTGDGLCSALSRVSSGAFSIRFY